MYKRCFTFGCSFTRYAWPTWADILHHTNDIPVTNWALPGIGNQGILHLMLECDLKYKFTAEDLILVMWTSWTREDRFIDNQWKNVGSVFGGLFYDKTFINQYWDWDNDVIRNASAIMLANRSFNIANQYSIMPYGDKEFAQMIGPSEKFDFYRSHLPEIPTIDQIPNSRFSGATKDDHPDVICHIDFYNQCIAPKFCLNPVTDSSIFYSVQYLLTESFDSRSSSERNCDIADNVLSQINNIFAPTAAEVTYY